MVRPAKAFALAFALVDISGVDSEARHQDDTRSWFDRMASWISDQVVAKAWFFCACVLMVLVWAPSIVLIGDVDTWQLIINTSTTIVTFLLVALLQNTQSRSDAALHAKLDAVADALADLMDEHDGMEQDVAALKAAVGLEQRNGS